MKTTSASVPKRNYVETLFERFFAWPKSVLTGNQFYYREDGNPTYLVDVRVPKENKFQRFFAHVFFYLFFPMNFLIEKIVNASENRKLIRAEIKRQHLAVRLEKQDIRLHEDRRPFTELRSEFFRKEDELQTRFSLFFTKIAKPEDWDKEENIAEFNAIFHDAALTYPVFLTALHNLLVDEDKGSMAKLRQLDTPWGRASRVKSQGTATPYVCFQISYNMLLEMYRAARSRLYVDSTNQPHYGVPLDEKKQSLREDVKAFYDKDNNTIQCQWRRIFNANMKLFRTAIGGKEVHEALKTADFRVYFPTLVDSNKHGFFRMHSEPSDAWRHDRKDGSENFVANRKLA